MCGILGVIPAIDENKFKYALDLLEHRGPDGFGIWTSSNREVTFGHRRLSIIDLSDNGKQPMQFGDYCISFNGEIYNYLEIKKQLEILGHSFSTDSDTEVLLKAFIQWKEKALDQFNGMWSLAIWNDKNKSIFLSRDRFGKKPLFYAFIKNRFVFGSEMKAIMPFLDKIEVSNNFNYFKQKLFDYENTDQCLVQGIQRFPKASYAYYQLGDLNINPIQYWETREHLHAVPKNYEDQVQEFRELFLDACKLRMRSDVSIGTALSGGLDSSATICGMAKINKDNQDFKTSKDWQHAFIASFPGSSLDETKYAKEVVDYLGIPGHYTAINSQKGIENIAEYLFYQEELYLTSPIPMMELYGSVRKHNVFVTLDGHGADELFSGYANDVLLGLVDAGFNQSQKNDIISAHRDFSVNNKKLSKSFYEEFIIKKHAGKLNYIKSGIARKFIPKRFEDPVNGKLSQLNEYLYGIFHHSILPTLLRNYDRYSMANGVEIRMPFMDHRLVTYSFSIPWHSKLNNGFTKSIIRDAIEDFTPKNIVRRKDKIGFNTPILEWLRNDWKEFFLDTQSSTDFRTNELVDFAKAKNWLNHVLNEPEAEFWTGQEVWNEFQPYFWGQGFLNNPKIINAHKIIHE